jgi:hypothetical protein
VSPGERWEVFKIPNDRLARYAVLQSNDRGAKPVIGTNFRTEERAKLAAAAPALHDSLRALLTFIEGPAESLPYWEKQEVLAEIEAARDLLATL